MVQKTFSTPLYQGRGSRRTIVVCKPVREAAYGPMDTDVTRSGRRGHGGVRNIRVLAK